jgi:pimeloyl-ACP methyl ester carboxylesterase
MPCSHCQTFSPNRAGRSLAPANSYDDVNFTPPYLSTITARTLIVHGDRDEFFPVDIPLDMFRFIRRAYLLIIPNTGHELTGGRRAAHFQALALAFLRNDGIFH